MVRARSVRAALLLSSAVIAGQASAQTVTQSGPGDVTYTNSGTVTGTPRAVQLTTPNGAITANIGTVTATSTATTTGSVVAANNATTPNANAGAVNVTVGTLTSTGGGNVRGIDTRSSTGATTINVTNLNVAGSNGIFANGTGNINITGGALKLTATNPDVESAVVSVGRVRGPVDQFGNSNNIPAGGNVTVTAASIEARGNNNVEAVAIDAIGNISVTAGTIVSDGSGLELDTNAGTVDVKLNGNVTTVSGAVSAGGRNVNIAIAEGVTVTSQEGVIEAEGGSTVNVNIDSKGRVIATTPAGGGDAQGAFYVQGSGTLTVKSAYAESNDANTRGLATNDSGQVVGAIQSGTINVEGTAGPVTINADRTVANGNGMRGINATATSGSITITANETTTAGNSRSQTAPAQPPLQPTPVTYVQNAAGIAAQAQTGNIAITSGKVTLTGTGNVGISGVSSAGTATITSGSITATGTNSGIVASGGKGAKVTADTISVANGFGIQAISSGQAGSAGVDVAANSVVVAGTAATNANLVIANALTSGNVLVDVGTVTGTTLGLSSQTGTTATSAVFGRAVNGTVRIEADNVRNDSTQALTFNNIVNNGVGSGISGTGRGVTIVAGNVEAQGWAIRASTVEGNGTTGAIPNNDGRVSITTTGAVNSRLSNAISINGLTHSFDVTVGKDSVVTGHATSALAGGARVGDIVVNNSGKIVGAQGSDGAIGVTATGGGNVTITSNETSVASTTAVSGTFASGAIAAVSLGGNGKVSVTSTKASVVGAGRYGIYTSAAGTGTIGITSGALDVDSDQSAIRAISDTGAITIASTTLNSSSIGVDAVSNSGAITVTTGTVTTAGDAVMAETGGAASITVNGAVTSNGGRAVRATGATANVTVNAGASVRGASLGVIVAGANGNTLTNNGTISSVSGPAVAFTGGAAQFTNAGTITGGTGPNLIPAVVFGAGNDTMTLRTGSVVNGIVSMGGGNDTVVLNGTVNSATATQTLAQFAGAENLNVDAGYWTASSAVGAFTIARIATGAALQINDVNGGSPIQAGSVVNNGRLLINYAAATPINLLNGTQMSGSGSVSLIGKGTLVLSDTAGLTYTGGTTVADGKLQLVGSYGGDITTSGTGIFQLGNGGTTGTYTGNLVNNGTFIYDRSDSYTLAGNFSGSGSLVKNGAGVVTFGGTYGFTGTTTINGGSVRFTGQLNPSTELDVRSGTVDLSNVSGGRQTVAELQGTSGGGVALGGSQLTVDQTTNTAFAGNITGTGGIAKTGSGTLDLTGTSTYTGQTRVDGGTLKVNGAIAGSTVVVNPGATLGGNGTVGGIQAAGGTLSPGNSIGRLTVNGNITLTAASTYTVEANAAGQADRVDATGTAALGGARLQVLAEAGRYRGLTSYTILTAAGGVSGQFGTVTSNFAFLTPSVTYGSNAVTLNLRRNDASFASFAQGTIQLGVANAITSLGAGNALFEETLLLQDNRVATTFASLSGELHGGIASGMVENAEALRRTLLTQSGGSGDEGGFGWASFTGNWGKADATTQNARLKTRQSGLLGGVGYSGNGFKSVIGVGSTTASFDAAGHADADSTLVLATSSYQGGGFSATIGGSYAWHDFDTRRTATLGTITGGLTDAFKGTTGQIFGEVGYGVSTGTYLLTPFVGVSHVRTHTDAVTETGSALALNIAEETRKVTFVDAGVRLSGEEGWSMGEGTSIAPFASAAWRRAWGDRNGALSARFAGGGAAFSVLGPVVARSAAELGLGLELRSGPVRVSAGYNGSLASDWTNHSAQMKVSIGF